MDEESTKYASTCVSLLNVVLVSFGHQAFQLFDPVVHALLITFREYTNAG